MDLSVRSDYLAQQFAESIREFEQGAFSSRGLALKAEKLTTVDELQTLDNELLSHAYWVMRHLVHQPACWAPTLDELKYVYRCLIGEESFSQEVAEGHRL
ncbi:MAG: hypothetical protein CUN55_03320 [Phototrophicales bacterium]|nr:MAG: hypothetical protein CUN55_03320 [Phototrophicales bacterium]